MRTLLIKAATVAAALAAGAAVATPLQLANGGSGIVPVYDGRMPDQTNLLAATCGYISGAACSVAPNLTSIQSVGVSILQSSGGFIEVAGTTQLNPYGANDVAFAFIVGGSVADGLTGVTVSSLAGYSTSVEGCGPEFGSQFEGCATGPPGNAARNASGNSIAFSNFPPPNDLFGALYTDGYVIYTNAPVSALVDPNNFVITESVSFAFAGLGLTPPSVTPPPPGAPEPATLGLLGLGLAGVGMMKRRKSK